LPPPGEADAAGGVPGQAVGDGAPYSVEWRDGLALVRLTAGKANALNARSLAAVERALDEAAGGGARGVILTGYARFFSAGLDLVTLYGLERDAMDGFMAWFDAVMLRVFAFPRPVVAAIGGHAVAGGAVLALACDARVMGASAGRIGLNEIRLGVPFPASALEIVRHAVPATSVESVLYEGELFDPRAALERGLVTEVTEGDVVDAARRVCGRLAAAPAGAFETIKAALKGPAVERARATLAPLRRAFVDAWYAPEARHRIGEARARLSA
jgi:enoyl-CoA hydratase